MRLDRAIGQPDSQSGAISACLEVLTHAIAGHPYRDDEFIKNAWFLTRPNPDYNKRFTAFPRPDIQISEREGTTDQGPLAEFFSDLMLSVSAEGEGMCDLKTTSLGGSVFLMSKDRKVVLKSMVANEAPNWQTFDKPLLTEGTYPAALVPALAYFEVTGTPYFVMQGVARMGLAYGLPDVRLLDMKGLIGREYSDEYKLLSDFPKGFGMTSDMWEQTCYQLAEAIDFLTRAKRMDYSMLVTMHRKPLSRMDRATQDELLVQTANGVFFASDVASETDFVHPNDDHQYAFHLQGFADHLETYADKTLTTLSTFLVNLPRTDTLIKSNPIQTPKRYGCRMLVFLMTKLFVPVHNGKVVTTGLPWRNHNSFGSRIAQCTDETLFDTTTAYAHYLIGGTLSRVARGEH